MFANKLIKVAGYLPEPVLRQFKINNRLSRILRPVINRLVPSTPVLVTVASGPSRGIILFIDPTREKFYWPGQFEIHVQHALVNNVQPGDVVWDIGAHIGAMSLLASRLVGPSGTVHAFEPMDENRERLKSSVGANHSTNIVVHAEAVGASAGIALLHSHSNSLQWSLDPEGHDASGQAVKCVTIDGLTKYIGAPRLIKIDAEGAELDVIKGGLRTINEHRPTMIVEFTDNQRMEKARLLLPSFGFENIGENHWLLSPQPQSAQPSFTDGNTQA